MKRKVSLKALDYGKVEEAAKGTVRQTVNAHRRDQPGEGRGDRQVRQGAGPEGRPHQMQGDQLRVSGKKRDDLQAAIQAMQASRTSASRSSSSTSGTSAFSRRSGAESAPTASSCVSWCGRTGCAAARPAPRRRVGPEQAGEADLAAGERVDDVRCSPRPGSRSSGPAWRRPRSSRARGRGARRCRASRRRRASASYSRDRERAIWSSVAAIGARIASRAAPKMLPPSSSSPPPPKIAPHIAMRATNVIAHRDRGRDRSDEDVAVAHVRQLVGEHAPQLVLVEHLRGCPR